MMGVAAPKGLLYASSDGWQAASLPYLGRELEMVVLVPDAGRFADVESRLDEALDISEFPHQAFLSVDEEGTDASATTVIPSNAPPRPVTANTLKVDRPFIVMVIDRGTNEPLFLGRVLSPTD